MSTVRYRAVPGYPRYRVGSDGTVWTLKSIGWRLLRLRPRRDGYVPVCLYRDGKAYRTYLHRLLLTVFDRPPRPGEQSRHLNGQPWSNFLANLRWGSARENGQDRVRHRTVRSGTRHPRARLSAGQVRTIRRGRTLQRVLAVRFGVSVSTISNAARGRTYRGDG